MTQPMDGRYTISQQQSAAFAELSGDYNPLHVDAVYARRLQFGHPVIHGVHHLLSTWDAIHPALLQHNRALSLVLDGLSATFPNPVSVGQEIEYRCEVTAQQPDVMVSAFCGTQKILSLKLKFTVGGQPVSDQFLAECPPKGEPLDQNFPPVHTAGQSALYFDQACAAQLFPNLVRSVPAHQLARVIACTRIVGMECPGLNSIFAGIRLNFNVGGDSGNVEKVAQNEMRYAVSYQDARVQMLKIDVHSNGMTGTLDTFLRPTPVKQPDYARVCTTVANDRFSSQRALVIGGSRGVGETTAKLLCAGGADVIITYHQGREEARKVAAEINAGGAGENGNRRGRCHIAELDITALSAASAAPLILFDGVLSPTHIYYFASPHITANRTGTWNPELFNRFSRFYLDAFSNLVAGYAGQTLPDATAGLTFFYPSSIFVEQPENGFAEYAVAKGAGEVLCTQFALKYPYAVFRSPRLPRMATDQSSSIIPIQCESVLDVMRGQLETI